MQYVCSATSRRKLQQILLKNTVLFASKAIFPKRVHLKNNQHVRGEKAPRAQEPTPIHTQITAQRPSNKAFTVALLLTLCEKGSFAISQEVLEV